MLSISFLPFLTAKHLSPSVTRSVLPVITIIEPHLLEKSFMNETDSSMSDSVTASAISASTPRVLPLPPESVFISEAFPLMTSKLTSFMSISAV